MAATKPKVKRKNEKVVQIHCEWENCESIVTLQPLEYETFSAHLKEHADEFILRLKEESGKFFFFFFFFTIMSLG